MHVKNFLLHSSLTFFEFSASLLLKYGRKCLFQGHSDAPPHLRSNCGFTTLYQLGFGAALKYVSTKACYLPPYVSYWLIICNFFWVIKWLSAICMLYSTVIVENGVAGGGGKWEHTPRGAFSHFLLSFKSAF